MSSTRYPLTAALMQQIEASIRAGGYPHVAAAAYGVPVKLFKKWLRKGRGPEAPELYAAFRRDVRQAYAQARLRAENQVFTETPRIWLEHGPGRERPKSPGWTGAIRPPALAAAEESRPLESPRLLALLYQLLEELRDHPELRLRVGPIVENIDRSRRSHRFRPRQQSPALSAPTPAA